VEFDYVLKRETEHVNSSHIMKRKNINILTIERKKKVTGSAIG
jgi:hypothetical protein